MMPAAEFISRVEAEINQLRLECEEGGDNEELARMYARDIRGLCDEVLS